MSVTTVTATGTAAVDSLEVAFDVMTPIDLSLVFTGWGPLPAITHVEEQSGPWDHVGVHRRPQFADAPAHRSNVEAVHAQGAGGGDPRGRAGGGPRHVLSGLN